MKSTTVWKGGMAFESTGASGNSFVMDSHPDFGGENKGPSPVEALVGSMAACSAMDVLSIMHKKKQKVTSYKIEVEYERGEEGVYPRPITKATIKHILEGEDLNEAAVERSVQLSDEKYCTVLASLRTAPEIVSTWSVD